MDLLTPVDREPVEGLEWLTWADPWRDLLREFATADLPEATVLPPGARNLENWSLPLDRVDPGLARLFNPFVHALLSVPLGSYDGAALLCGMLDEIGDRTAELYGLLRELILFETGDERSVIAAPVGSFQSGWMHLHVDILGPELMLNIFQEVPPARRRKRGATYLLKVSRMLDTLTTAGLTPLGRRGIEQVIAHAGDDEYAALTGDTYGLLLDFLLYGENPDAEEALYFGPPPKVDELLFQAATAVQLERGEGYLVNDRLWMHGRGPINWRGILDPNRRLFRLTFSNGTST